MSDKRKPLKKKKETAAAPASAATAKPGEIAPAHAGRPK